MKVYRSIEVANTFIQFSVDEQIPLTQMKLLKLVFIAHGWCLAKKDRPLIVDAIVAWKYGPVIPDLYYKIRSFGTSNITNQINEWGIQDTQLSEDQEIYDFLKQIFDRYKKYDGLQLSTITHQKGSPWETTVLQKGIDYTIEDSLIKSYYKSRIDATKS